MSSVELPQGAPHRTVISSAAVSERQINGQKITVVNGTLEPQYFNDPFTPPYQRIEMTGRKQRQLMDALRVGGAGIPDPIMLGLRSSQFALVGGGSYTLTGPLAIIDGLQRISAGRKLMVGGEKSQPLGVQVLINTEPDYEQEIFDQINRLHTRVAAHVFMRNLTTNAALAALRKLIDEDEEFVLGGRVQWDQFSGDGEVITAHTIYEVVSALHGVAKKTEVTALADALQDVANSIGTQQMVENTKLFFNVVDRAFGLEGAKRNDLQLRLNFLRGLAVLFAQHENFWRDNNRLFVSADDVEKIGSIEELDVRKELASSRAAFNVSRAFRHHIDRGRTKNKLRPRYTDK